MDTEKGGEQTQYESEHTHVQPPKKSSGQLGAASSGPDPEAELQAQKLAERGERTAENVRYGQGISENQATVGEGEAGDGGYGRVKAGDTNEGDGVQERVAQGFGGDKDMDKEIGA
ncbi:hypothetical protein K431DRAFT_282270 [Polychaeton citri CBS 116435]|uniref:Uncharacterized protein n=1 Tax=Polychaeton citri CBS 116435 TaxID=1314669 RepID=A0A9P4QFM1_9PEZI|nr:hypothetical protein K431DRAFT_282270 [Polychaeton citri CBS 116435]